ncbi:MAG: DinB family protein [Chloroflexi bacterium]|nr:DinB family protein [Chloroflexota bacterium]
MNTVELLQYSLGFAFDVLDQVTADLTQEQADWAPPGVASSIGSIYSHLVTHLDFFVREICLGQRFELFAEPPPPEIMMQDVQVDMSALYERAKKVRAVTEDWLASLSPAVLDVKVETPIGPLNVGQMVEAYIIWHINVHCGEISALKGCQGAKGYPF